MLFRSGRAEISPSTPHVNPSSANANERPISPATPAAPAASPSLGLVPRTTYARPNRAAAKISRLTNPIRCEICHRSESAAIALHEVQQSAWSAPYYALTALWGAALVTLAWAAARAGVLGPAPAALLALGTIAVGLEGVVQDNTYFIASSALLLLGGAWAGVTILRLDDATFAVGRHR